MTKQPQVKEVICELLNEADEKQNVEKALNSLAAEVQRKENADMAIDSLKIHTEYNEKKYYRLKKEYREYYNEKRKEELIDFVEDMIYTIQETEDRIRWKRYKKQTTRRLKAAVAIMSVVALMFSTGYAWYLHSAKNIVTEQSAIMTPYTLYLLDGNTQEYLQLSVGDIHPGETKQVVVCVSSHDINKETTSKDGVFQYNIELAYTQNLPITYRMYELESVDQANVAEGTNYVTSQYTTVQDNGNMLTTTYYFAKKRDIPLVPAADVSEEYNNEMYGDSFAAVVNKGKYDIYDQRNDGSPFTLSLGGTVEDEYNYYLVEMSIDVNVNLDRFAKETDLIYLIAKAKLPKPSESVEAE